MSQHHQGCQQGQEVHRDIRHYMHHVIPNTSSTTLTHGTGHAATDGHSSSFQTPGQAVSLSPYAPPVGDQSRVPSFSSSNHHASVAAVPKSLEPRPMGHGQSKPALPLLPQSLASAVDPVLDAGLLTTKGMSVAGGKLKRAFGAKRKESNDPYFLASKETSVEAIIGVSKSISSSSRPTEYAPSIMSASPPYPPSQVLDNYLVTSPTPLPHPSPSFSGPTTAGSSRKHPKSSPSKTAAGNRNSVIDIALNPGISSAINFMMMECQDPSASRLVVDTSSSSLPSGDAESSKPDRANEKETLKRHSGGPAPTSPDKREMKESWRKSDSTNSHHTVRANSLRASRPVSWAESFHSAYTIVPANGAPPGPSSRRLSGLITDVDFGVREEELEEDHDTNMENSTSRHFTSFNSTHDPGSLMPDSPHKKAKEMLKKAKRRSISLSSALPGPVGGLVGAKEPPFVTTIPVPALPSAAEVRKVSHSISGMDSFKNVGPHVNKHSRQKSENLLLQRPPIPSLSPDLTHHVPSMVFSTSQPTSRSRSTQDNTPPQPSAISDPKGNFQSFLPPLPKGPPAVPPDSLADPFRQAQSQFPPPTISASHSSHNRQPTISGLGPSAANIAKRAVERMGKRLGDMINLNSSSNNSVSGHSSSTSISTSASTSVTSGTSLIPSPLTDGKVQQSQVQGPSAFVPGRTTSRGSNPSFPMSRQGSGHAHHHSVIHNFLPGPSKSGGHKRLQKSLGSTTAMGEAVTSGASTSNLSSTSESDPFSPTGPILGRRLRGPNRKGHVFGRELRLAVKETKVVVREDVDGVDAVEGAPRKFGLIKALECRVLPAVVARCAQHLLIWGVQEEGLFRVNGRPRHVSHLRAEFDSGADYDMTECSLGELDPHAVASIFKAYLRELPDSILTKKLQPYFDAAINKENSPNGQQPKSQQHPTKSHQGLPSCPRDVGPTSLHKPPSLSTLAMPSFNHVPPPSRSLINAFRSLISQLPPENRDLLRTVVDLIKATARGSKATKMPLSNLLLLFCPSLNLSPPLLRLLCEAEGIWEEERLYLPRGVGEDESDSELPAPRPSKQNTSAPRDEDETDARSGFDEASSLRSGRASSDNPSSLDYHASAEEDSLFSEDQAALGRRDTAGRPEIPTVYLDTQSHLSSSSGSLSQDAPETPWHTGSYLIHQEMPDDRSISSDPYSPKTHKLPTSPSLPLLSSSADTASTHTSSTNPSLYNLPLDGTEKQRSSDADLPSVTVKPSPQFVVVEPLDIRKRPVISNPIPIPASQFPFPTSRGREHAPAAPSRRRSIPLLSLSSLSSRSSGSPSPSPLNKNSPYHAESRSKKTSLKLLFSKKSSSSLLEDKERERPIIRLPFLHPPEPHFQQERASPRSGSGSDSSVSTPLSAVTAPQGSGFFSLLGSSQDGPPVLNTLIEDSSLKFDEAMNSDKEDTTSVSDDPVVHSNIRPSPSNLPFSQPRNEEWMRSIYMAADADLTSYSKLR